MKHLTQDPIIEKYVSSILTSLGFTYRVSVLWNSRLVTTAGRMEIRSKGTVKHNQLILNPRLKEISEDAIDCTLRHELAHLIAERPSRRRIAPHGKQWKDACALLGIPDESSRHTLPFKRHPKKRKYTYICKSCATQIHRVLKIKRKVACLACCKKFSSGRYDERFKLQLLPSVI